MKSRVKNRQNQLRIIAGEWRGRKLDFPSVDGLRPTPDRVRETLFNWLQAYLPGARCLDLFAGSGVLGFEALSRGAGFVSFIERERAAFQSLRDNVDKLQTAERVQLVHDDALHYLDGGCGSRFDIIFLDPPYGQGLVEQCLHRLEQQHCLREGGLVYMEHEVALETVELNENWSVLKNKKAGQVNYYLLRFNKTDN